MFGSWWKRFEVLLPGSKIFITYFSFNLSLVVKLLFGMKNLLGGTFIQIQKIVDLKLTGRHLNH
jgi:hypothetical protein